jgi:hypothetical protein
MNELDSITMGMARDKDASTGVPTLNTRPRAESPADRERAAIEG